MALPVLAAPVAGTLGTTFSAIFVGANLGITYMTVPVLLLPSPATPLALPAHAPKNSASSQKPATEPGHLARQWQATYSLGSKGGPFAALLASVSYLYAARTLPSAAKLQKQLFIAAAGLSLAIVPFTFVIMARTNHELHRRADAATKGAEEDFKADAKEGSIESYHTPDLVRWWATLNIMRASLHIGAIGSAMTALFY